VSVSRDEGADWTPPRTSIQTVAWPPLPAAAAVRLMALGQQLDESQWWPSERLRAHQLRQLQELVMHAASAVPFYRERLRQCGIDTARPLGWDAYARLPILARRDLREHGDRLRAETFPKSHGDALWVETVGGVACPARVLRSGVSLAMSDAFALRAHGWRRERSEGKLAVIRALPPGAATSDRVRRFPDWGRPLAAVYATGSSALLDIRLPTEKQADWLRRERVSVLQSAPSNLLALAEFCRSHKIGLPALRTIRSVGETVTPELRAACREAWDLPVLDEYAARDIGVIALQCPDGEHYHAQSEATTVEILDAAGRPCGPGEIGQVVLTPFHNFAMPLLRYAPGDYAEVGDPKLCPRGLPAIARILGRARGRLTLPSGERRFSLHGSAVFRGRTDIRRFQFVQRAPGRLETRLIPAAGFGRASEAELRTRIAAELGGEIAIDLAYPAEIGQPAEGSFHEFRSELG